MLISKLVKGVLDRAYCQVTGTEEQRDATINEELVRLGRAYGKLIKRDEPLDYGSAATRFAYIFKYVVAHADYVNGIIAGSADLRAVFDRPNVIVTAVGGGPGSDLVGILKYLLSHECPTKKLMCYLFDRERAWSESWGDVGHELDAPFHLNTSFQDCDVTDSASYAPFLTALKADLFTFSYFISEIQFCQKGATPFFEHLFRSARSGAKVLFIDNNDARFWGWFIKCAEAHGVEFVEKGARNLTWGNDEEKRDLGEYFDKFGWPKRQSDAYVAVGVKR